MKKIALAAIAASCLALGCSKGKNEVESPGDETTAGTPCEQEIALECPDGQMDGCLADPREVETHQCVEATAAAPDPDPVTDPVEPVAGPEGAEEG